MNGELKRRRFVYQPPDPKFVKRALFDQKFSEAIWEAYKRDATALCELLRSISGPLTLTEDQLDALITLIETRMPIKARPRGRRSDSIVLTEKERLKRWFISCARRDVEHMRQHNGGKLPRGGIDQAFANAETFIVERCGYAPGFDESDCNYIRSEIKRKPALTRARNLKRKLARRKSKS